MDLLTKDYYFIRKPKKLSFIDDMKLIMSIGLSSIKEEMYKYFDYSLNTVSASHSDSFDNDKEKEQKIILKIIKCVYNYTKNGGK